MSHRLQFVTCDDGTIDVLRDYENIGYIRDRRDLNSDCNGPRLCTWESELFRKEELEAIAAKMGEFPEVAK